MCLALQCNSMRLLDAKAVFFLTTLSTIVLYTAIKDGKDSVRCKRYFRRLEELGSQPTNLPVRLLNAP